MAFALLTDVPTTAATGAAELGTIPLSSGLDATVQTFEAGGAPLATLLPATGRQAPRPFLLSPISWSGDGQFLIASGFAKPRDESASEAPPRLYLAPAEGGAPVAIPGSANALYPVGLPDGKSVVFVRVRGEESETVSGSRVIHRSHARYSIWLAGIDGSRTRRLTPWRINGYDVPTSASPDGSTLTVTRVTINQQDAPRSRGEAVLLDLKTGNTAPLRPPAVSATFSPDGAHLALVIQHAFPHPHVRKTKSGTTTLYGESDIAVKDLATGESSSVTSGPGLNIAPSWDPSGQRLAFVRFGNLLGSEGAEFGLGDSVYEVNADGSCLTRVLHEADGGFTAPAWRPGSERGAGPIAC